MELPKLIVQQCEVMLFCIWMSKSLYTPGYGSGLQSMTIMHHNVHQLAPLVMCILVIFSQILLCTAIYLDICCSMLLLYLEMLEADVTQWWVQAGAGNRSDNKVKSNNVGNKDSHAFHWKLQRVVFLGLLLVKDLQFTVFLHIFSVCSLTFFAFHCLRTITHEHKSAIFFRSFVQVESEVQTRLPLDSFSRSLCFCGSFVSVFSCLWLSVTFWRPGSECSMRERAAARSEFKERTQRAFPRICSSWRKIQEVGLVLKRATQSQWLGDYQHLNCPV